MRAATNGTGVIVSYTWMDDNGKMQIVQWENNKKVIDSTSKNKSYIQNIIRVCIK